MSLNQTETKLELTDLTILHIPIHVHGNGTNYELRLFAIVRKQENENHEQYRIR